MTVRLKGLVEAGVLERRPTGESGCYEGYHLTGAGEELRPVVRSLLARGDKWAVTTPPLRLVHHGHPLVARTCCATCGDDVEEADLTQEMLVPGWDMSGRLTAAGKG